MQISVVGVSYHETPISVRERFAFAPDELRPALARLVDEFAGAALLSTCNRSELYLASESDLSEDEAVAALVRARASDRPEGAAFYHLRDLAAVGHLYEVASGIDSLVVGESEILGQVREAFSAATAAHSANSVLARLFHTALRAGRRARNETEISAHGLSVAAIAVSLSRVTLGDLRRKTVLIVGAGEVGQRAAAAVAQAGAGRLLVTTRISSRADDIARDLNAVALPFSELTSALAESDMVISATAATEPVITRAQITEAMSGRQSRPLLIVDIAVPRDVEGAVREVPGVQLFDIDDLEAIAARNLEARRQEVAAVEVIVAEETRSFAAWLESQAAMPTLTALQKQAEQARLLELEKTLVRLPHLSMEDRSRVEALSKALVKRLLDGPTTLLRQPGSQSHAEAVRELFRLKDDSIE